MHPPQWANHPLILTTPLLPWVIASCSFPWLRWWITINDWNSHLGPTYFFLIWRSVSWVINQSKLQPKRSLSRMISWFYSHWRYSRASHGMRNNIFLSWIRIRDHSEFMTWGRWFSITGIKNKTLKSLKIFRHLIILIQLRKMFCYWNVQTGVHKVHLRPPWPSIFKL